jgi:hypothetical protein
VRIVSRLGRGLGEAVEVAALYRGLAVGAMSIVAPVAATTPVGPAVVGVALGELPSAVQAGGIALAATGIVLIAREEERSGVAGRLVDEGGDLARGQRAHGEPIGQARRDPSGDRERLHTSDPDLVAITTDPVEVASTTADTGTFGTSRPRRSSVSTIGGITSKTRMPGGLSSARSERASECTAALVAA